MDPPPNPPLDPAKHTLDKHGIIRPDFLFSYWVIMWFLMYYFIPVSSPGKISSFIKTHFNPLLAIYFAFAENILTLFTLAYRHTPLVILLKYIAMIAILKGIPLYLLRKSRVHWIHDIAVLSGVFLLYLVYLQWNETNLYEIYRRTFTSVRDGKTDTPGFALVEYLYNRLFGLAPSPGGNTGISVFSG